MADLNAMLFVCRTTRWRFLLRPVLIGAVVLPTFLSGCSTAALLPSAKDTVLSPWDCYAAVASAFERIVCYQTDSYALRNLKFSPDVTPNIQLLTHIDLLQRFLPNQSISLHDLDEGLRDCLAAQEDCHGYEICLRNIDSERYGNILLDLFNFRRQTKISGWEFRAIIVLKRNLVVYKISGGKPNIDEDQDRKNPLGPLQSSERIIWQVVR